MGKTPSRVDAVISASTSAHADDLNSSLMCYQEAAVLPHATGTPFSVVYLCVCVAQVRSSPPCQLTDTFCKLLRLLASTLAQDLAQEASDTYTARASCRKVYI